MLNTLIIVLVCVCVSNRVHVYGNAVIHEMHTDITITYNALQHFNFNYKIDPLSVFTRKTKRMREKFSIDQLPITDAGVGVINKHENMNL